LKTNFNGKVHTSQEGSLRVWQNWAHFSLLIPYFSQTVSSTPSWSAARAHFLVRSDLNCLHLSPTVWSNFFFRPTVRNLWDFKFRLTITNKVYLLQYCIFWLLIKEHQIKKEKYLNILPNQVLLSSRDLLPVLVRDVHLITCQNPLICP